MTIDAGRAGPDADQEARDLDQWLGSLETLFRIPPEYRNEQIPRAVALEMLAVSDNLLDTLIKNGLPCSGDTGEERFDRFDLVNLALYAKVPTSVPVKTMRFALRWMHESPDTLFTHKTWDFTVDLSCPHPEGCGDDPRWTIAHPKPELQHGEVLSLELRGDGARADGVDLVADTPAGLGATAKLVSGGERRTIQSAAIRDILNQYTTGYRWVRMPEELQWRPELVLSQQVAPCIAVTLDLVEQLRAAGFEARTRRGWILGMLDLAHSWLEVRDSDGELKMVDPAFMILAADHCERPHPDFRDAAFGSQLNRLLPTEHHANQPVLGHVCGGRTSWPTARTAIQLAAQG